MIFEHAQYFDTFFCFYMKNDLIELRASFPLKQPIYMHWNVWVWNPFISLVSFYSHFPPLIPQTCTPWSLKSPPTRLFIQKFIQASIKINIQVPHYCYFCGGNPLVTTSGFHSQRPVMRKSFIFHHRHILSVHRMGKRPRELRISGRLRTCG